ncbi:MAG: hypothetical protein ACLUW4_13690 [Butyribacter sp.]|jgi:dentin sialophosphoprotein variant B (fragment)|uniref:hypothetical protein n=2 Tax=Butyribacter TaxID=2822463 RepID=UPI00384887B7|nr:hypothetical protein [Clostridium sp.]MCQ5164477.1 hypothetical protein [Roseburia hominis]
MYINVKRCRKVLAVLLGMCLVLSGCSKKTEETTNDISSVKLKSNQEIVACKITAIYGNEIEYTVVKEQSASDSNSKKGRMPSASGAPDMNGGSSQGGGAHDMNGGEMPQGGGTHDTNGGNSQSGGAPDMNGESSQFEDSQNSSSDKNSSQSSSDSSDKKSDSSKSSDKSSKKIYTLTDETGSTTIPVGTDVITSLGKTTTFSRLSNGDIIKMIMEKDSSGEKVVVGVWIVS